MTTSNMPVLVTSVQAEAAQMIIDRDRAQGREPADPIVKIASVEQSSAADQLAMLLNKLDRTTAEILRMRFAQGLSAEDVAEALRLTPGAVRMRVHRGLSQLRRWIEDAAGNETLPE